MRRVSLVRRDDGETVPFDEARVADVVGRALAAAGTSDERLAAEIASVVSLFLEKTFFDEVPSVADVEDMIERVLIDTGHAGAAKAFILHRERRSRQREARAARDGFAEPTLFDPRALAVDDGTAGTSGPYVREALARTLAADPLVARPLADEVAAVVEERLRRAAVSHVPSSLVRALAESELLARDAPIELRRRAAGWLPPESIEAAIYRRAGRGTAPDAVPSPALAAQELGSMALRSHTLASILPADVARGHLDADVHVHGLALPGALYSISFSPDEVKRGSAPGAGTRGAEDAALSAARLAAATTRSARLVAASASGAAAIAGAPQSFAPLCAGASRESVAEHAWQLVLGASADPGARRLELDMTPGVPDAFADEPAVGGAGQDLPVASGDLAGVATSFAAAMLRAHARGAGLPPRELLPVPIVGVTARALADPSARAVLRQAAELALRGDRVVFPLLRDRGPVPGTTLARPGTASQGGTRTAWQGGTRTAGGRVTLNLPRAAVRAGRGNVEGFLRECDRLVDLAVAAHRARRELLVLSAAASGGPLAPLFRAPRGRAPLADFGGMTWSVGVTGLNEAVASLTGFELHEGDESAVRTAKRVSSYLSVRVKAAGMASDLALTLDADEDGGAAMRFLASDRRRAADSGTSSYAYTSYTPGIGVRPDAPVDLLLRIGREEPLHAYFATATLRLPISQRESGGPDGVVALLAKCLESGSAVQTEVVAW